MAVKVRTGKDYGFSQERYPEIYEVLMKSREITDKRPASPI